MLRVVLWFALCTVLVARGEVAAPAVTEAQLDAAVARVNNELAADDPERETLLKLYADTRAELASFAEHLSSIESFTLARDKADAEAESLLAQLKDLQTQQSPESEHQALMEVSLEEAEQLIQVDKSELAALKGVQADTRTLIDGMSARAATIRDRLTEVVGNLAQLESQLSLMNASPEAGSEQEARLWQARAEMARAAAEKASLDVELLSQPMRRKLAKAQLDKANYDISVLEARLAVLDQRAAEMRKGEAEDALAEAELVRAGAQGKDPLVQELAEENAELTASFSQRNGYIEAARAVEAARESSAEEIEGNLKAIERKLEILGMTTVIGEILREQAVQLPTTRQAHRAAGEVTDALRESSLRQIELEEERRQLRDPKEYVEKRLVGVEPGVAEVVRDDLHELALNRHELIKKAIDIENKYVAALGDLEFTLRRYDSAVDGYRDFISERLLWIPSRETFSIIRHSGLSQLQDIFVVERWREVLLALPAELVQQPLTSVALLLVLVLIYLSPRLLKRLEETGRNVGYLKTDTFSDTTRAVLLSLLLALKWPLLMLAIAWLFQIQESESTLAAALSIALARTALYFWGLEFMRVVLLPKGLAFSHFRWPVSRVKRLKRNVVRLERTFIPATFLVVFAIDLYPREVGGQLAAIGVCVVLLSISLFFSRMPHFVQGKIDLIFVDQQSDRTALWARFIRVLLVWMPVGGIVAVMLGYSYTAIEFALLLIQTMVLYSALLFVQELGLRWLRLTRRRMVVKAREELSHSTDDDGDANAQEEFLENDPELLSYEGSKFLNALVVLGSLAGIAIIWSEVFPALGILDSVELWNQNTVIDGLDAIVPVTLGDLFFALIILLFGWVVARRVPGLLEIFLRQRMLISPASAYAATRVFQYTLTTILVVAAMSALGGSWSQIQWAVAALSVGIGFGLQEIVANFISGLIILFEQPIRVGDTVTVGEVSGTVTKIRIRATTIRDWDRRELLVPNKEFVTNQLLNWSLSDPVTRTSFQVGVAYGTDMSQAMAIVRRTVRDHHLVLDDPEPLISFDEFGDNSLVITVRYYIDQLDKRISTASEVRLTLNERFNEAGIVVAFPQRDVHLDASGPLAVTLLEQEQQRDKEQRPEGET